jgi:hypothetical protein
MYAPSIHASDRLDRRINELGASLFFHPVTTARAGELGVDNVFVLYGAGRAGAMGNVTATQAASALGFFPLALVQSIWQQAEATMRPADIARIYADAMATAARADWNEAAAETVVELGTVVADSVPVLGLPLFAGWRDMARPPDALGAAAVVVNTLRELRGDIHVQSIAAQGLHPLEAEVVSRGDEGASLHQWPQPWPDPAPFVERVGAADASTGERMRRIYARSLDPDGFNALTDAIDRLAAQ